MNKKTNNPNSQTEYFFDISPIPMWVFDIDTLDILAANQSAVENYGFSKNEFASMNLTDIRPEKDIPILKNNLSGILKGDQDLRKKIFRQLKSDGSIIYTKIRSNSVDYNGKEACLLTAMDVSDSFKRERTIKRQKRYLDTINRVNSELIKSDYWIEALNNSFKIIVDTLDIDRISFFKNNIEKRKTSQIIEYVKGYEEPAILNTKLQNRPFREFPLLMTSLTKGQIFKASTSQLQKDSLIRKYLDEKRVSSLLVMPLMIADRFYGFIEIDDYYAERNWTEDDIKLLKSLATGLSHKILRNKDLNKLIQSNEKFKLAMQVSNEMIWEIDHKKTIIKRGSIYKNNFNYKTEEYFEKDNSWFSNIIQKDSKRVWKTLQNTFSNKNKDKWKEEYKIQSGNGKILHFIDRCHILRNVNGNAVKTVGSSLNVSESRKQLEQIQSQNNNLREIAWLQSHVIRAPLARIMGLVNLIKQEPDPDENYLEMISSSADELDSVIHQIIEKTNTID